MFDKQAKMMEDQREVTTEEFMAFQASHVLPFPESVMAVCSPVH